jgi:D-alanine-D-alanine ligase
MKNKTRVVVVFGSRSVEHEVSVVTAMQIMANLDREKYEVIPVYIDKAGKWWSGKVLEKVENYKNLELRNKMGLGQYQLSMVAGERKLLSVGSVFRKEIEFDIVLTAIHGTYGEDGTLQGLLEMVGVPYTGCGVTAAAVGMDKVIQKAVFEKEGLPVVKYEWFWKKEYEENKKEIIERLEKKIKYPMFVKPANLGSSVGINMAKDRKGLEWSIDVAKEFDTKILIEKGLENIDEINVSVMGFEDLEVSVCEQPIKANTLLSYQDKYMSGSKTKGMANLSRLVPAPISKGLTREIQSYALMAFRALGAAGISRIDFLVNIKKEIVYINEINTLPGSLAYYLWEKTGYTFSKMLDRLIELGFERYNSRNKINFSYDSGLLREVGKGNKN